jgi:hypothetical protein
LSLFGFCCVFYYYFDFNFDESLIKAGAESWSFMLIDNAIKDEVYGMGISKKLPDNQITVYQTADGKVNIEVLYANENIWLTQKKMAELFGCTPDNISLHLKNIYKEKELEENSTTEVFSVVQKEGA